MNIHNIPSRIISGEDVSNEEVLLNLKKFYDFAIDIIENKLNKTNENIGDMIEDIGTLSNLLPSANTAKALAETIADNQSSLTDEHWRKTDTADYKLTKGSSTIHMKNLNGKNEVKPYIMMERLLTSLYFTIGKIIDSKVSALSSLKFEIEHNFVDYTIRRKI